MTAPLVAWARLAPELIVADLAASLRFWCGLVGFRVAYERHDEGFAFLDLDGAQVMLEQRDPAARQWLTAPLEPPLGRGTNFQIEVADLDAILARLAVADWPLFLQPEEKWYRVEDRMSGQRQCLVQDPDGYLLRLAQWLGDRPVEKS